MDNWGWRLIIIGALSFLIPIFDRQFIIVTLLGLSGMGAFFAGLFFISTGTGLLIFEKYKNSDIPSKIINPIFNYVFPAGIGAGLLILLALAIQSEYESKKFTELANSINIDQTTNPCRHDSQTCLSRIIPTERNVENGIAKYLSAINWSDGSVHLYVSLTPTIDSSITGNSLGRAILVIRNSLCGIDGILHEAGVTEAPITLIIYEKEVRLGEYPLPTGYCPPVQ